MPITPPSYAAGGLGLSGYRRDGQIATDVQKGEVAPVMPRELFGIVSPDIWVERVSALQALHTRFFGSLIEKICWIVAFFCALILPWPLMSLVDRSMQNDTEAKFWEIKMIGLGLFFGCGLFFFAPLIGWKCLANYRLKTLLAKYKKQDSHRSFPASMQVWSIQTTSFTPKPTLTIIVTLPPPPGAVSTFHPDAYLPAYIQKLNSRPSSPETNATATADTNVYAPPAGPPPPPPAALRKE
ncbi:hypothetical protein BDY24DRAFT_415632 [Mrakia frigida]|uniref:uncharacterized protein n=1 Tax=Mrakia frigida TaxID=29902 RepID=UPI003FCBFE68